MSWLARRLGLEGLARMAGAMDPHLLLAPFIAAERPLSHPEATAPAPPAGAASGGDAAPRGPPGTGDVP